MGQEFINPSLGAAHAAQKAQQSQRMAMQQTASQTRISEAGEGDVFNPTVMARRSESLEGKLKKKEEKKADQEEKKITEVRRIEAVSERYQRQNNELQPRTLLALRSRLSPHDTKEDVLRKVLETYADYSLADEALDFLLETSEGDLREAILQAKKDLNALHDREIRAGRNMGAEARAFSEQGLGSPTGLRDLYRDLTGNPREPPVMFEELAKQFPYNKMRSVIDFVLHSLGSDLKAKGPSISRAELHRLMGEARTMQAILGIYRFFKSRMRMISSAFLREDLELPALLNFELLAKQFMKFLQERYPSSDKALALAAQMGISEALMAQIIIYTQMRDAVRQVAPKLFKSDQHRQDIFLSLIETLEELDEKVEEEEEKENG